MLTKENIQTIKVMSLQMHPDHEGHGCMNTGGTNPNTSKNNERY